jgi:Sigma-54 interaction domain
MLAEHVRLSVALVGAKDFAEAASTTLRSMLLACGETLSGSRYAGLGRRLRATVHMRPDGAHRRSFSLEVEAARASSLEVEAARASDQTALGGSSAPGLPRAMADAWRTLVERRAPLSLEVEADGDVAVDEGGPHRAAGNARADGDSGDSGGGFARHDGGTYLHAVPVFVPGGAVEGMITIEAERAATRDAELIWPACADRLQLMAALAMPYLVWLPSGRSECPAPDAYLPVIGAAMAAMLPRLTAFAREDEILLLTGPMGTGKSRLSRFCHEQSRRRGGPFEVLDLTAVPEEFQMSGLFGWRTGACTGATRDHQGSIARAEGGTLFIDEIDRLSLEAQAALLRFLDERIYRVLGESPEPRRANVRLIVGTGADLQGAIRAGTFREDLYYRIGVLPIRVPSLGERRDEIPRWADHLLAQRHRESHPDGGVQLSPEAEQHLSAISWPGNLRQLESILRRAYALSILERGEPSRDVSIEQRHIAQALGYEVSPAPRGLSDALHAAALAFIGRAQGSESGLDLDLADAFRGFVLGAAVKQLGHEDAFRIMRRESLVKHRNHHKALRRELEKVDSLLQAIGELPSPFEALREEDDST